MKTTAYVTHSDCSLHDTGWAHPEHQGRLAGIARAVYRDMLALHEPLLEVEPEPATADDLLLVHSPAYVQHVRAAAREAERIGEVQGFGAASRVSGRSWDAAVAAVGAGMAAVDAVLDGTVRNAFCAVRPPGSDVGPEGGEGFGIFNTAAVAAAHLRGRRGVERVLILEVGAAAGRGTAAVAAQHPGIRYASVHERTEDGWTLPPETVAVPIEAGSSGGRVQDAIRELLQPATIDFRPGFLILSLGLDALSTDPVGGLAVEPRDLYDLTGIIVEAADELCGGRLVSILEGGYDARAAGSAVVHHLRSLADLPPA